MTSPNQSSMTAPIEQQHMPEINKKTREAALTAAAQAFCNRGIEIACPWEGDLDDLEQERFDAMKAAIDAYNEVAATSAVSPDTKGEAGRIAKLERALFNVLPEQNPSAAALAKARNTLGETYHALAAAQTDIEPDIAAVVYPHRSKLYAASFDPDYASRPPTEPTEEQVEAAAREMAQALYNGSEDWIEYQGVARAALSAALSARRVG